MNNEQFKHSLLECMKDEEFVHELRAVLSGSIEFENLISEVNDDIKWSERNNGNPYSHY